MAITDNIIYDLKPQTGDSSPHNEIGGGDILTGGTIALVSAGAEGDVWQFSGADSSVTGPTKTLTIAGATGGFTMAVRMKIATQASVDFTRLLQFQKASDPNIYLGFRRDGANSTGIRYNPSSGASLTQGSAGASWHTYVIRVKTNGASNDSFEVWRDTGVVGTRVPDQSSTNIGSIDNTWSKLLVGGTNGAVVQIQRWVITTDEKTDAECSLLVEDINGALAGSDTTVPVMTGTMTANTVTSSGFTVDWSATTRSDNVAITGYEYKVDSGSYIDAGNVTSKAITGLTASTSYTISVRAYDAAGNRSTPALTVTQATSAVTDTTPPTMTGTMTTNTVATTSFTVDWSATTRNDNVAITGYEYKIDSGSYIDAGNVTSKSITGLTASTAYVISVQAYDAAGNKSTPALTVNQTTASASVTYLSDTMTNNTGTVWPPGTTMHWSWYPLGRIGSNTGITVLEGSGALNGDSKLSITGISAGAGLLLVAKRVTNATDDFVYYEAGTAA